MKAGMIGAAALAIAACMGSANAAGPGAAMAGLVAATDNVQTVQATADRPASRRRARHMRRMRHSGSGTAMRGGRSRGEAQGSDAAYMGGGMVQDGGGGSAGMGGMGGGSSSMPGTMGGTTGGGMSGMQQSPMGGSGMGMGGNPAPMR